VPSQLVADTPHVDVEVDRSRAVPDTNFYGFRVDVVAEGDHVVTLPKAALYQVAAHPIADLRRGVTAAGGRDYPSKDWQPGEQIEVINAAGKVVARLHDVSGTADYHRANGAGMVQDVRPVVDNLPAGPITFRPSSGFIGRYAVSVRELPPPPPSQGDPRPSTRPTVALMVDPTLPSLL
jgi:hypothetical protein